MYAPALPHQNSFFQSNSPRQSSSSHARHRSLSFSNGLNQISKHRYHKKSKVSSKIRENLERLSTMLEVNDPTIMSLSLTEQEYGDDYVDEYRIISVSKNNEDSSENIRKLQQFAVFMDFLSTSKQPFRCIGFYTKLLTFPQPQIKSEPILYNTLFPSQIHPIITLFLEEKTQFYQIRDCHQKILDIFYKFIFCEHGHLMERNLKNSNFVNLGKWFYEEGLMTMLKKYFPNSQDFTMFFINFLKYGLAALFIGAVCILENKDMNMMSESKLQREIKIAKIAYIEKYGIV